jgi:hypothetical protein
MDYKKYQSQLRRLLFSPAPSRPNSDWMTKYNVLRSQGRGLAYRDAFPAFPGKFRGRPVDPTKKFCAVGGFSCSDTYGSPDAKRLNRPSVDTTGVLSAADQCRKMDDQRRAGGDIAPSHC